MKTTMLAALTLATIAGCRTQVITAPPPTDVEKHGQMAITGTATLEVSPDCADLTMTLSADDIHPHIATALVTAREQALVAGMMKLGLTPTDLKLSLVTLEPVYEPNREGWAQIKVHAYRAQITVTATTHDFTKISAMMEAGVDAGATSMSSQFRRSDLPALKKQVRASALAAAKDKAKQTADALGIKLGRIVSVSENTGGYMWNQPYFPQVANEMSTTGSAPVALGGTLQPLTLDVSIGYELAREI